MNPLLLMQDLSLQYELPEGIRVPVLRGASLSIQEGEVVGLHGRSGSGKTTLLRYILGMPMNSAIAQCTDLIFESQNLLTMSRRQRYQLRRSRIGIIFQDPANRLSPFRKIYRQIADALDVRKTQNEITACLDAVGFSDSKRVASSYAHTLSGGECQRVAIAQALTSSPSLLLADEPTSSLDTVSQRLVLDLLLKIRTQRKMAMLVISHDPAVLSILADRVVCLRNGVITEDVPYPLKSFRQHTPIRASTGKAETLLEVRDLSLDFTSTSRWHNWRRTRTTLPVLQKINFRLERGECLAFVGASGSGKSTLAKCLVGIHPVQKGAMLFCGRPLKAPRQQLVRSQLQLILQDSVAAMNPRLSVAQILKEPVDIQHSKDSLPPSTTFESLTSVAHLERVLAEVSLSADFLERYPQQLSGGERQRVAIARGLILHPKLLLLDEVLTGLDHNLKNSVLNLLESLRTGRGLTCIHFSHDLGRMLRIADRILVMDQGKIVETHSAFEFPLRASHPASRRLLDAMLVEDEFQI